jgi:large subunit ribosomal protein L35
MYEILDIYTCFKTHLFALINHLDVNVAEYFMPKMKTRKSAAKRYSVTGTGKVKRNKCGLRHKLEHKSSKVKNRAGNSALVHQAEHEKVRRMLPYAF